MQQGEFICALNIWIQMCPIKKGGFDASQSSLIHLSGYLAHTLIASDIQDLYRHQEEQFRPFRLKYKDLPSEARIWLSVLFPKEKPSKACSLRASRRAMVSSRTQVLQLLLIQMGSGPQGSDTQTQPQCKKGHSKWLEVTAVEPNEEDPQ